MKKVASYAAFLWLLPTAGAVDASAGEAAKVVISNLEYQPAVVTVRVGETVSWRNDDIIDHTATASGGAFDVATPKGKTARWRAVKPGEYRYVCRLHPNMSGVVRVIR